MSLARSIIVLREAGIDITIIGTGNMARGIGTRALAGGNGVTLIGHDPEKARALAGELGGAARAGEAPTGSIVVLALHYGVGADVGRRYAGDLDGKVVVDISNPVDFASFEPIAVEAGSAAEEIAAAAPAGAHVVKAFNTTFAGTLVAGEVAGQQLDVLLAGDDEGAKAQVAALAESGGLRAIDVGPLRRARELEALGYLHMALQDPLGAGFGSAVKLVV